MEKWVYREGEIFNGYSIPTGFEITITLFAEDGKVLLEAKKDGKSFGNTVTTDGHVTDSKTGFLVEVESVEERIKRVMDHFFNYELNT